MKAFFQTIHVSLRMVHTQPVVQQHESNSNSISSNLPEFTDKVYISNTIKPNDAANFDSLMLILFSRTSRKNRDPQVLLINQKQNILNSRSASQLYLPVCKRRTNESLRACQLRIFEDQCRNTWPLHTQAEYQNHCSGLTTKYVWLPKSKAVILFKEILSTKTVSSLPEPLVWARILNRTIHNRHSMLFYHPIWEVSKLCEFISKVMCLFNLTFQDLIQCTCDKEISGVQWK